MPTCRERPVGVECPHSVVHGSIGAYNNHRCRCQPCRVEWAKYTRDLRRRRRARLERGEVTVEHGLSSTYLNWGCRCPLCREAHTQLCRSRLERAV